MSIQQKGDVYYVVLPYRDSKGKKKYKWYKSGKSIKAAQKMERQLLTDIDRGQYVITDKMILSEFLDRWIDTVIKPNKRPSTTINYQAQVKNLKRTLGSITLDKLNALTIQEHYNSEYERGLKPTSVQYQHAVLKQALDKAVAWQFIMKNPCDLVDAPKRNKPKNAVFTPEQVQTLLDVSKSTSLYLPLLLGFLCGLRRGEICGLRWQDINLKEKSAFIQHSLDRMDRNSAILEEKKGHVVWWMDEGEDKKSVLALGPVKTDESQGYIPLPGIVIAALRLESLRQKKNKLALGEAYNKYGFVWAWEDGKAHDPDYLYHAYQKKIKSYNKSVDCNDEIPEKEKEQHKLPLIRVHDMRHTHATLLLRKKIDIKIVSKKIRHKRSSFTADYYQHVQNDMQDETATAMDELFNKKKSK